MIGFLFLVVGNLNPGPKARPGRHLLRDIGRMKFLYGIVLGLQTKRSNGLSPIDIKDIDGNAVIARDAG